MNNLHVALCRIFGTTPRSGELQYHWWFVREGPEAWGDYLIDHGVPVHKALRIIHNQLGKSQKLLETWDTEAWRTYAASPRETHELRAIMTTSALPPTTLETSRSLRTTT